MRKPIPRILIARLSDFTGGLNLRDDAYTLKPNELTDCLNMRVMPQGGMRQRKTLHVLGDKSNSTLTDSFNRANSASNLGSTDGGTILPWVQLIGTFGIASNAMYAPSGGPALAYLDLGTADCDISITTTTISGSDSGFAFRVTDANNYWRAIGHNTQFSLSKVVAGSVVAFGGSFGTINNGDVIRVACSGDVINVYSNGVLVKTVTDSFNDTATKHGIYMGSSSERYDSWSSNVANSLSNVKNLWSYTGNGTAQIVTQNGNDATYSTGGATFTPINPDALTLTGVMRAATMYSITNHTDRLYVQRNAEQVPWTWDGTTATVLADASGAYNDNIAAPAYGRMPKAKCITTHGGFMFHANIVEGGVTKAHRVRWSHPGEPEDYRTNDFVDVGVDDGDAITGIVSAGTALYIFKARSVWRLAGYDSATWQLSRLHNGIGSVSQEACALSPQGIYFFDGTRGAFLLELGGKLSWLWEKLYCKLADNTIPSTYVQGVTCGWLDNRLWVAVPWKTSTAPVRHFVYDPLAGKAGAWYKYQYSHLSGADVVFGPMLEWRPDATTVKLLQVGNANTAVFQLEYDESSIDTFTTAGSTSTFNSFFTTAWFTAGAPGIKKQFKRPTFIVNASKATTIAVKLYRNFQTMTPKSTKQLTVTPTVGSGILWGAGTWGGATWGATATDDQAIIRSSNIGNLYAVQLNVSTPPGSSLSLNAVEFHYLIRRF